MIEQMFLMTLVFLGGVVPGIPLILLAAKLHIGGNRHFVLIRLPFTILTSLLLCIAAMALVLYPTEYHAKMWVLLHEWPFQLAVVIGSNTLGVATAIYSMKLEKSERLLEGKDN